MDDETAASDDLRPLPGNPLPSGFESGRIGRVRLTAEAEQRVLDKMRSVDEARARAAQDSRTAYVG